MKKLFVVAALVMGVGTTVSFAAETTGNSVMTTVTAVNEYTPIEVKDLLRSTSCSGKRLFRFYRCKCSSPSK